MNDLWSDNQRYHEMEEYAFESKENCSWVVYNLHEDICVLQERVAELERELNKSKGKEGITWGVPTTPDPLAKYRLSYNPSLDRGVGPSAEYYEKILTQEEKNRQFIEKPNQNTGFISKILKKLSSPWS